LESAAGRARSGKRSPAWHGPYRDPVAAGMRDIRVITIEAI
jgi:hypothetical protein